MASVGQKKDVTFFRLACSSCVNMKEEEECGNLTDAEIAAALRRDDELGLLVSQAFLFAVAPFCKVMEVSA